MSLNRGRIKRARNGFPRVSGDEPMRELMHSIDEMFSPRERG